MLQFERLLYLSDVFQMEAIMASTVTQLCDAGSRSSVLNTELGRDELAL